MIAESLPILPVFESDYSPYTALHLSMTVPIMCPSQFIYVFCIIIVLFMSQRIVMLLFLSLDLSITVMELQTLVSCKLLEQSYCHDLQICM